MAKTAFPMGRGEFVTKAKVMTLAGDGVTVSLIPREFSTGSVGWGFTGKVTVMVDGVAVPCQCSFNATAIGSKPEGA